MIWGGKVIRWGKLNFLHPYLSLKNGYKMTKNLLGFLRMETTFLESLFRLKLTLLHMFECVEGMRNLLFS